MSFFDFFRNFFGVRRHNEPSTSGFGNYDSHREIFLNPIWQWDEDNDDDDDIDNFRHPKSSLHFNIFSNPLEMTLYFEIQMDNMLKNLLEFNTFFEDKTITALPFAIPEKDDNLRDKMLKSKPDESITDIPSQNKVDRDLDGRISTEEFSKIWNEGNLEIIKPSIPNSFSIKRSVRKEIVRRPDGIIEEKQVIRDNEGNEETIISKKVNDKTHVVTIRKDKNGIETRSEDLLNIDENKLEDFTQKWKSMKDNLNSHDSIFNRFPWEKFFAPNPKL